jgi:hypothetical protein
MPDKLISHTVQRTSRTVRILTQGCSTKKSGGAIEEIMRREESLVKSYHTVEESVRVEEDWQPEECLGTLTINIPRFHNLDGDGRRKKMCLSKLKLTLREMRDIFSGYTATAARGWNKEDRSRDSHYRFEIDFGATPCLLQQLKFWKRMLELRFGQHSMYMRVSLGARWL